VTDVLERDIKQKTKKRGFDSVSDYIKNLVVADEDLISEEELLEDIRRGEEDYKKGKVIRADSIADLVENADKYRDQLRKK
jgi:Arc/MetJ-type ribon-helix-helix transcriptional regulator